MIVAPEALAAMQPFESELADAEANVLADAEANVLADAAWATRHRYDS